VHWRYALQWAFHLQRLVPTVDLIMIVNRPARPHRHSHRLALALLVLPAVLAAACGSANTGEPAPDTRPATTESAEATTPSPTAPTASEPGTVQTEESETVITIRIIVGDQMISAELADNPTAQDLASQLPLSLNIRDFNGVEKIAALPRSLTMDGVPAGDDPDINDIGYYAPSNDLVFYYGEVGYFNGIVRIGQASGQDIDLIERQPDGTQITIEQA
jgi:hypothetical protein